MRTSRNPVIAIRPTKTSLARQSITRGSIVPTQPLGRRSLSQVSNTYSEGNVNNDVQYGSNVKINTINIPLKGQQHQRPKVGDGVMKNAVFKRRSVKKLATILSGSSLDNSTKEGETLKQVIVSSLTETVKKLEIAVDDQENKPLEQQEKKLSLYPSLTGARRLHIPAAPTYPRTTLLPPKMVHILPVVRKELEIVTIEPSFARDNDFDIDELDEDEYRVNGEIYVMNYVRDIMNLLYALESYYPIDNSYLQVTSTIAAKAWKVTLKHRTTLVEWLIQLFYCRFHLAQDSLHVCIQLLDRFLQHCSSLPAAQKSNVLTQKNLQLIGIATLLLATKIEETHHPSVEDLVFLTNNAYKADQLKRMEKKILQDLQFELNRPTSLQFLRRYSFVSSASDEQHSIGKYLIDLTLLDYHCINLKPSLIAASATYIALYLLTYKPDESFDYYWPEELRMMTPYKTYEHLSNGIKILATLLLKISTSKPILSEYNLLFKKYEPEHLSGASTFCVKQQKLVHKLANGCCL